MTKSTAFLVDAELGVDARRGKKGQEGADDPFFPLLLKNSPPS
jgi:hypothetical protein